MIITRFTDQAIRSLIYLEKNTDHRVTISAMAADLGESFPSMQKVSHRLAQLGLIKSVRGRTGHITLNAVTYATSVGWLVDRMETKNYSDGVLIEAHNAFISCLNKIKLKNVFAQPDLWSIGAPQ